MSTTDEAKVLVIEDEVALADGVARGLRAEGFDVEVAYDGVSGLNRSLAPQLDLGRWCPPSGLAEVDPSGLNRSSAGITGK